MVVPEELAELTETGSAVIVGTRDERRVPELSRGWGVSVLPDRLAIEVCVPTVSGRRTLENLAANRQVALTIVRPTTYRSFQVKGIGVVAGDATPQDLVRVARHQRAFVEEVAAVGMAGPEAARLFSAELSPAMTRIRIEVESLFDQTPGPGAGARL